MILWETQDSIDKPTVVFAMIHFKKRLWLWNHQPAFKSQILGDRQSRDSRTTGISLVKFVSYDSTNTYTNPKRPSRRLT